ncbi:hypothetical protein ACTXT7_006720 [Hymenolepis weldensis]
MTNPTARESWSGNANFSSEVSEKLLLYLRRALSGVFWRLLYVVRNKLQLTIYMIDLETFIMVSQKQSSGPRQDLKLR